MNSFYEHHKHNIQWHYRCFDRILLNGVIQPFQRPERVVGFFNTYRQLYPVTRQTLRGIAEQFQRWVSERAAMRKIPVVEAPKGRRDDFVDPYFERAKPDQVVVILKAREPARIMIAIGDKIANRWHLQIADRWVTQYNFYINDKVWGRIFVRICPYLPFSARVCLNQHHWLANRMRQQGIAFNQLGNAFLKCSAPDRLQKLADSTRALDTVSVHDAQCEAVENVVLSPRSLRAIWRPAAKNGWLTSRRSSPQMNDSMPAASIHCSSRRSSSAATAFSAAAPPWISLANVCSMPIGRSDNRIRSP